MYKYVNIKKKLVNQQDSKTNYIWFQAQHTKQQQQQNINIFDVIDGNKKGEKR